MNAVQWLRGNASLGPPGSLESRTAITPGAGRATSTQSPLAPLWLLVRQAARAEAAAPISRLHLNRDVGPFPLGGQRSDLGAHHVRAATTLTWPRRPPPAADAARLAAFLDRRPGWSAFWDKRYGLWRAAEDDPASALYAETPDPDAVIAYITARS